MFVYEFCRRGKKHLMTGNANEDAVKAITAGNATMIFVADGMGSAERAETAARTTVDIASKVTPWIFMPHPMWSDSSASFAIQSAFAAAYNALQHIARGNKALLDQLQTTFMGVIYNASSRTLTWGHCGDGGIIGLDEDGRLVPITRRQKGEHAWETTSILDPSSWRFGVVERDVKAFAMMTDGLLDRFCPYDTIDQGSYEATSLKRLLMLPENASGRLLSTWLDRLFDPERDRKEHTSELQSRI